MELYCYARSGPVEYIQPQFSPWVQEGISRDEAEKLQSIAAENFNRAIAQKDVYWTNGAEDYIAPGETREIGFHQSLRPGDAVFLQCSPQSQLGHYNLFGYGTVQDDLSVKSSIPVDDNEFPLPVTSSSATITRQVPTTVRETVTVTTTVAPATVTETITQEPTTRTVSVTAAPVTVTTTRQVPTTVRVTATPTREVSPPSRETTTVTTTVSAQANNEPEPQPRDSVGSVIGWVIGVLVALGFGGVAGFLARDFSIPGLRF